MAELIKLGNEIKAIRGARTQQEFARILEISQGSVAKYENGLTMPRASILLQIAELGQISLDSLLKKASLSRSSSQSAQPPPVYKDSSKDVAGNSIDLIMSLKIISEHDQKLGQLVTKFIKSFSIAAENPGLRKKGRAAVENALKAIGYSS